MTRGLLAALIAAASILLVLAAAGGARTDSWSALPPAQLERSEVAAARIGHFIYVVGGFERSSVRTSAAVERYDIRRRTAGSWCARLPIAVNHPTAVAYRGRLYVHGGYRAELDLTDTSAALLRYDPERNRWRRLRPSPTPRAAHAVAVIGHRLYAAGGANETGSLRSLEIYDFRTGAGAAGRASTGPRATTPRGSRAAGASTCSPGATRKLHRRGALRPAPRRWERMPPLRTRARRDRLGPAERRAHRGVRRRAARARRHDDRRGGAVRPAHRALALAPRHAHPAPRPGRSRARPARVRARGGPDPGLRSRGRSSSSTCPRAPLEAGCSRSRTTSPPAASRC